MSDVTVTGATRGKAKASALAKQYGTGAAADYAADSSEQAVSEDSLPALQALAEELLNEERGVADCVAALKKAVDRLADVQEKRLPDLMEKFGMEKFYFLDKTTGLRRVIKLESKWRVSMPPLKDDEGNHYPENEVKRKAIYEWFRGIGLAGIIKKDMLVPMGLVPDAVAMEIMAEFKETHPNLDPGLSEKIEPATLTAQVSRLKDAGKAVHEDIVVKPLRRAKVTNK